MKPHLECKYALNPTWNEELKKDKIDDTYFRSFIPDSKYTKAIIFISSNIYKDCYEILAKERKNIANFYEVYGVYDFIVEGFFKREKLKNEIRRLRNYLLRDAKSIKSNDDIVIKVVKDVYAINNKCKCIRVPMSKCFIFKLDLFHMMRAFVKLSPNDKTSSSRENVEILLDLLTDELGSKCSRIVPMLIYRIYVLQDNELLIYLNIDCKNISEINMLTTTIDRVVDRESVNYKKTTFISTIYHYNNAVIDNIESKENL